MNNKTAEFTCINCKSKEYKLKEVGTQTGLYCATCGRWQKWVAKTELHLYKQTQAEDVVLPSVLIINGIRYIKEAEDEV